MFSQIAFLVGALSAAVASGMVAGVFLTFSDFVMRSLAASQSQAGVETMQQINREVYRSVFMVLFMGLVPVSGALFLLADIADSAPVALWLRAGAVLYVAGVFVVTAARNVPMNKKLDRLDCTSDAATAFWPEYVRNWTRWNHVRAVASLCSAICFLIAAVLLGQSL